MAAKKSSLSSLRRNPNVVITSPFYDLGYVKNLIGLGFLVLLSELSELFLAALAFSAFMSSPPPTDTDYVFHVATRINRTTSR
jgi:hypothetical protein